MKNNSLLPILFFLIILGASCNNEKKPDAKESTGISKKEEMRLRIETDSLLTLIENQKGAEKYTIRSRHLNQILSNGLKLQDDTLLASTYFKLAGQFGEVTDFTISADYYYKAFELFKKLENYKGVSTTLNNLGWVHTQAQDYKKGLEICFKGLEYSKKIEDTTYTKRLIGFFYNTISITYLELGMADSALKYNQMSYASHANYSNKLTNHLVWIYAQFGNIYAFKNNISKAEEYFRKVIDVKDSALAADAAVFAISKYCHLLNRLNRHREAINIGLDGIRLAKGDGGIRFLVELSNELRYASEKLNNVNGAYQYAKQVIELKDSIFDARKSIQLQNMLFMRDMKANELNYEIEKAKSQEKLINEKRLRNLFLTGFILVLVFAGTFFYQRNTIRASKIRSDELLLNILPGEVAEELKNNGITKAKQFDQVTVMFTDFKNFTQIAERLTPQELVSEIHFCFKAFDEIISKFNIEKIKTIGDAYMCAGGLPVANLTHASDVVKAAIEIQRFMRQHMEMRSKEGKELFEIRIGIHTGPVVAGVVGIKKFAYDIWGDTVNTASRMESGGEVGKVNISGATFRLVKEHFNCVYRGKIEVKNKGEMDMYFVEV